MSTKSSTSGTPAQALTTISGGINRLKTKGGADKNSLFDLLNGYVTQSNTVKVRPGTWRNADIANYSGAGNTKGLMSYQGALHVFSASVVDVPPGYELHVLNYPSAQNSAQSFTITEGQFASATQIGNGSGYGLVSLSYGFAVKAIINPQPGSNVGSTSPTTAFGTQIAGFFQAIGSSTHDPGEVYVVFAASPALPPNGVSVTYTSTSGPVTVNLTLSMITNVLALPAGYVAYALGTGAIASDPLFADTSLLLLMNGANTSQVFTDSSVNALAVTNHGASTQSTSEHPSFQATAGDFTSVGGTQYLSVPVTGGGPLDLSTGDFTIEGWIYVPAALIGGEGCFISSLGGNTQVSLVVQGHSAGCDILAAIAGGYTTETTLHAFAIETWTAFALTVTGTAIQLWINGVASGTPGTIINRQTMTDTTLNVGQVPGSIPGLIWLADIRITKGVARYSTTYTPAGPFGVGLAPSFFNAASYPIKEIHFSAPYLGGIYVVAEFDVPSALAAANGDTFHYWIQSSTGSDNANEWAASTDYNIGDVVIPTSPNGLTYVASRLLPANPVWTPNTLEAIGNIVEPTVANGFKYTVTADAGLNPSTGATEPTWPTSDGATILESSDLSNDQTVTLATAAAGTPPTATPARYTGLYTPPSGT